MMTNAFVGFVRKYLLIKMAAAVGIPSQDTGVKKACCEVLVEKSTCPGCGKLLTRHALLYRHSCKFDGSAVFLARKRRSAEKIDAKIKERIAFQQLAMEQSVQTEEEIRIDSKHVAPAVEA